MAGVERHTLRPLCDGRRLSELPSTSVTVNQPFCLRRGPLHRTSAELRQPVPVPEACRPLSAGRKAELITIAFDHWLWLAVKETTDSSETGVPSCVN
jgi:hypothetical protein